MKKNTNFYLLIILLGFFFTVPTFAKDRPGMMGGPFEQMMGDRQEFRSEMMANREEWREKMREMRQTFHEQLQADREKILAKL